MKTSRSVVLPDEWKKLISEKNNKLVKMDQLCVACNKLHPRQSTSCTCGHVLKDSITIFNADLAYRTRQSVSLSSCSSSESSSPSSKQEKEKFNFTQFPPYSTSKKTKTSNYNNNANENNVRSEVKKKASPKFPRVIYRCKSYKKAKPSEMNKQFDFSLFDSHDPCYPKALTDINEKIERQNALYKILGSL